MLYMMPRPLELTLLMESIAANGLGQMIRLISIHVDGTAIKLGIRRGLYAY